MDKKPVGIMQAYVDCSSKGCRNARWVGGWMSREGMAGTRRIILCNRICPVFVPFVRRRFDGCGADVAVLRWLGMTAGGEPSCAVATVSFIGPPRRPAKTNGI
jgi:hypothetical protein